MGHLISRAIRRFTQCSSGSQSNATAGEQRDSATSGGEQQHQQRTREDQQGGASGRPFVESIPVGQSIDSAEYASFEQNKENKSDRSKIEEQQQRHHQQQQQQQLLQGSTFNNNNDDDNNSVRLNGAAAVTQVDGDQNKPEVEEAVIKIQALVRGHLTRKALKDAQQQSATPSHPNAIGQSQFDEESLTRNPPSAVFLSTFPLNLNLNLNLSSPAFDQYKASKHLSPKMTLESIAEDAETTQNAPAAATISRDQAQDEMARHARQDMAGLRLSPLNSSEQSNSGGAVSPVPSEANASIDLNCDTPASASIDISDQNVKPTDRIASILHPKTATSPQINIREALQDAVTTTSSTRVDTSPPSPIDGEPSSGDSEQAAAIRIQSAFRGYKTRKHSPYRRRSPSGNASSTATPTSFGSEGPLSPSEVATAAKRTILRQQDATDVDREDECQTASPAGPADEDEGIEEDGIGRVAQVPEGVARRLSRQRQRDDDDDGHGKGDDHGENDKNLTTAESNNSNPPANIQEAGSIEEMTATEASTVREAQPNHERPMAEEMEPTSEPVSASTDNQHQHQHQHQHQQGERKASGALESILESMASVSQNVAAGVQSLVSTVNDTGLSAALDGAVSSSAGPVGQSAGGGTGLITRDSRDGQQRPSDGGLSIDTDSSNLGANFSLTEEILSSQSAPILPAGALTIDEDKSVGVSESDELASEARRLVDELTADDEQDYNQNQNQDNNNSSSSRKDTEAALEEVTNILEEQLEEAIGGGGGETQGESVVGATTNEPEARSAAGGLVSSAGVGAGATLDEVEQRSIELESDDIERRDPRGQVSEERAKSPQITTERPSLIETSTAAEAATTDSTAAAADDSLEGVKNDQASEQHNLKVAGSTPDDEIISGRSSPALLSSNGGGSSSDDEAAGDQEEDKNNQHQKQVASGGNGGAKNKKRNRNKKKGKK